MLERDIVLKNFFDLFEKMVRQENNADVSNSICISNSNVQISHSVSTEYNNNESVVIQIDGSEFDKNSSMCYNFPNTSERGNYMSLLFLGAVDNKVFCLSDSYCTDDIGNLISSSWQKITYLHDRNMVVGVTGENAISGKNIISILKNVSTGLVPGFNSNVNNDQFVTDAANYIYLKKNDGSMTNVLFGYYRKDNLGNDIPIICCKDIDSLGVKTKELSNNNLFIVGSSNITNLLVNSRISMKGKSFEEIRDDCEYIMENIIKINQKLDHPRVGGLIQKVSINEQGRIW